MKNYQEPTLKVQEDLAEGIFMASGSTTEETITVVRCSKGNLHYSVNSAACDACTAFMFFRKHCPEGFTKRTDY